MASKILYKCKRCKSNVFDYEFGWVGQEWNLKYTDVDFAELAEIGRESTYYSRQLCPDETKCWATLRVNNTKLSSLRIFFETLFSSTFKCKNCGHKLNLRKIFSKRTWQETVEKNEWRDLDILSHRQYYSRVGNCPYCITLKGETFDKLLAYKKIVGRNSIKDETGTIKN